MLRSGDDAMDERLFEIFMMCAERGMQVPFIVCLASSNGSVTCIRIPDVDDERPPGPPDLLAEHFAPEGFRPPLGVMVLDQTGEAAFFTIGPEGGPVMH